MRICSYCVRRGVNPFAAMISASGRCCNCGRDADRTDATERQEREREARIADAFTPPDPFSRKV